MNVAKSYRQAVAVLKPSRAKMAAIHARHNALRAEAEAIIAEQLAAPGMTAKELYRLACENRCADESELAKTQRILLLGMVRRGN